MKRDKHITKANELLKLFVKEESFVEKYLNVPVTNSVLGMVEQEALSFLKAYEKSGALELSGIDVYADMDKKGTLCVWADVYMQDAGQHERKYLN